MTKTFKLCSDGNVIQELAILNKESLKKYLKSGTKIKFKIPPYLELEGEIVGLLVFRKTAKSLASQM